LAANPFLRKAFDLVHARLVLMHVPTREQALAKLVAALKPGGWLVVEDYDPTFVDRTFPIQEDATCVLLRTMLAAQQYLLSAHATSVDWGRQLHAHLRGQGLSEVGMEVQLTVWSGGSAGARMYRANFEQIRGEAVASGLISEHEIEQVFALLDDPAFAVGSPR
jgi:SAM-dependent methyltransferase